VFPPRCPGQLILRPALANAFIAGDSVRKSLADFPSGNPDRACGQFRGCCRQESFSRSAGGSAARPGSRRVLASVFASASHDPRPSGCSQAVGGTLRSLSYVTVSGKKRRADGGIPAQLAARTLVTTCSRRRGRHGPGSCSPSSATPSLLIRRAFGQRDIGRGGHFGPDGVAIPSGFPGGSELGWESGGLVSPGLRPGTGFFKHDRGFWRDLRAAQKAVIGSPWQAVRDHAPSLRRRAGGVRVSDDGFSFAVPGTV